MFAEIAPQRRLPAGLHYFDYAIPPALVKFIQPGSVVQIRFHGQLLPGVVLKIKKNSSVKDAKAVESVSSYSLTSIQLDSLRWLSDYYHYPVSTLLPLFIPQPPKKLTPVTKAKKELPLEKKDNKKAPRWVIYDRWETLATLLTSELNESSRGQTLIISPDERVTAWLTKELKAKKKTALFVPKRIKKIPYWESWLQAQSAHLIVGNWQSLFWSYRKLQKIIILEVDNPLYHRAEQNPRLHLNDYIWQLVQRYSAQLVLMSLSPPTHMMYQSQKYKASIAQALEPPRETIRNLSGLNVYTISTESLIDIRETKGKKLIFLNFLGAETGHKQWHSLLALLHQEFPDYQIATYGGDKLASARELKAADIILATSKIFSQDLRFALTIMLGSDGHLGRADYLASEELRRQIYKLRQQSDHIIIETQKSEHAFFASLSNYKEFYKQELNWRKQFHYPPFSSGYRFLARSTEVTAQEAIKAIAALLPDSEKRIIEGKMQLLIRHEIIDELIDKIIERYHNQILIERNPYYL